MSTSHGSSKSKVAPHPFAPDPDLPHATLDGRRVCGTCHLVGKPGDARHTLPDIPEQADVLARYDHEEAE